MAPAEDITSLAGLDSDDEMDWEEVDVPDAQPENIEITIQTRPQKQTEKKKTGLSHADRLVRINCHKIHTICLLGNARIRNKWINDPLLHARLLSLTPMSIQNSFAMVHKSRVPDASKRGRLFETAIATLAEWWSTSFFDVTPTGHIRNRTFDEIQKLLVVHGFNRKISLDDPLDLEDLEEDEEPEIIRSEKSLMKHTLMRCGSRDTSAQLFTALCRALGIPARLVVSLQSVPWQAGIGKPRPQYDRKKKTDDKGKGKAKIPDEEQASEVDDDMEEVNILETGPDLKGKGKQKQDTFSGGGQRLDGGTVTPGKSEKAKGKEKAKPVIKLRKSKGNGRTLGSGPGPRKQGPADPLTTPPVFWTEVFSRADVRWLPVDPIRCIVNKRKAFDPSPPPASSLAPPAIYSALNTPSGSGTPSSSRGSSTPYSSQARQDNRMVYVVALEEDGYGRDVTPRYAREYGAKVAKMQSAGSRGAGRTGTGRGRMEWWECVIGSVRRPYQLHRDDLEDEELQANQLTEAMPTTMAGFKDHPLYVLSRHLKRDEIIHPLTELGKFRGEPVYARSSVHSLRTAETWMRSGRKVKEGEQPMKWVKMRAATVKGLRAIEVAGDGGSEALQGMYALSQTELYIPEPIIDGKVPKNEFGNIDLYVPSMLPKGGVHIPFKGVAKIARKLGFDYAEAVTGFEFRKRKAFPVIEGIVVAAEHESVLLEAFWEAEQDAEQKAREKREERVIKRWVRLVQGLRIRQRLQEQYAGNTHPADGSSTSAQADHTDNAEEGAAPQPGGFLLTPNDVVQAFHLPRNLHAVVPLPERRYSNEQARDGSPAPAIKADFAFEIDDDDDEFAKEEDVNVLPMQLLPTTGAPITMRELAQDAARKEASELSSDADEERAYQPSPPPVKAVPASKRISASANNSDVSTPPTNSRKTRSRKRPRNGEQSTSETERISPVKRGRPARAAVNNPAPTRVLRPRASRTATQIQQEKEAEQAYKSAIAR